MYGDDFAELMSSARESGKEEKQIQESVTNTHCARSHLKAKKQRHLDDSGQWFVVTTFKLNLKNKNRKKRKVRKKMNIIGV